MNNIGNNISTKQISDTYVHAISKNIYLNRISKFQLVASIQVRRPEECSAEIRCVSLKQIFTIFSSFCTLPTFG